MKPTKEQYELAAKAAGLSLMWEDNKPFQLLMLGGLAYDNVRWNPTEDNEQCFSLLCTLLKYALYSGTNLDTIPIECGNLPSSGFCTTEEYEKSVREIVFFTAVEVGKLINDNI